MRALKLFFHHLFNPHCVDCKLELYESQQCKSCETLQLALDQANREKHDLLNALLQLTGTKPVVEEKPYAPQLEDVKPKFIPWRVRQAELESADRVNAKILADKKKEIALAEKDFTVKIDPSISKLEDEVLENVNDK